MSSSTTRENIPEQMKCVVYGRNATIESKTIKTPSPGRRNHVLVKVQAVGLNPVDAKDVVGDKFPETWKGTRSLVQWYLSDKIAGLDFCGTVVEDSPAFEYGTEVYGDMPPFEGSLAEYISVPLDQICRKPNNLSMEHAASLPLVGLTALQAMEPHKETNLHSVLVVGASGGTGHVALQVARNLGATHITAVCSGSNASFVKECGATHVVDYRQANTTQGLVSLLQQAPGCRYSFVMDCVTSVDPADQALNYPAILQLAGNHLLQQNYVYRRLGGPSRDWLRAGTERILGLDFFGPHEKLFWIRFPNSSEELRQLKDWAEADQLKPSVAKVYDFSEDGVRNAFEALLSRRVKGKVAISLADKK